MIFKKSTFRQRVFLNFFAAFVFFIISILVFQYRREKTYKTAELESKLDYVVTFTDRYISKNNLLEDRSFDQLNTFKTYFYDDNTRVTVIDTLGNVLYDSFVTDYKDMENHLLRPEIVEASNYGEGSNIRHSETTGQDFYYYARFYDSYFIRCAEVYNLELRNFLKTERSYIFFLAAMFFAMWFLLHWVTKHFGEFVSQLKEFSIKAGNDEEIDTNYYSAIEEFGDIRKQIVQIYERLKHAKDELLTEKKRLFTHLEALNEGIAFYTRDKKNILTNSHFLHFANVISKESNITADSIFKIRSLKSFFKDIDKRLSSKKEIDIKNPPYFTEVIHVDELYFKVDAIIYVDKSFEILITDVTKPEKRRLLKQQLTSNIAHELKTPLASIKGYVETLLRNPDIPKEKFNYFLERTFLQSERLEDLLNDVSRLNNIENAGDLFEFKEIKLRALIEDVIVNLESRLIDKNIPVKLDVHEEVVVYGNDSLLSSIFQNFIENTINYAGENVSIIINQYLEDDKFYYFSYSDSGKGIPEEHLLRIFERFYRIDEGRTRDKGGTGLGLSIVKNAVQLHKGEISVRNKSGGGLEFLFSLAKG